MWWDIFKFAEGQGASFVPFATHCHPPLCIILSKTESLGEGCRRCWCNNQIPSRKCMELPIHGSLIGSERIGMFLNILLKSMVTAFILGLGQIEIETINESVSFQKNESWQLCTGSAFGGGGRGTTKG